MVQTQSRPGGSSARECGACALCCKVFETPALQKRAGVWCRHCRPGVGCAIYATRPADCRQFYCAWMTDASLPPLWKPDRSRIVLSISPSNGFLYAYVDPGSPQAWRKSPYYDDLRRTAKRMIEQRRHVIVFAGEMATLIMPEEAVPLGRLSAQDSFRVESTFGPRGPTYRAVRG
ncbi:MAG: hypothetical protein ABSC22_09780 [Roseiarcus sp.]|jgi:hypothetical protein